MARRKREIRRRRIADPKFGQPIVTQFVNAMMWDGKRSPSETIFYSAIDILAKRHNRDGLEIFHEALENVRPFVEVRSRRVGGATYQIPTEVRADRRDALAIRWLIEYARERGEKSMQERLAAEILEASQKRGGAVRKKEDTHRMAEANRAFAHYRW